MSVKAVIELIAQDMASGNLKKVSDAAKTLDDKIKASFGPNVQTQLDGFAKKIGSIAPQFSTAAQGLSVFSSGLTSLASGELPGFIGAAEVALNLASSIGSAMVSAGESIGQFATETRAASYEAQKIGVDIQTFTSMRSGLEALGLNAGEVTTAMAKLSFKLKDNVAAGGAVDDAFTRMGVSAFDSSGKIKPLVDVWSEVSDKFRAMPDDMRKTALSMELFEETGPKFLAVLNQGGAALKAMTTDASNTARALTETDVAMSKRLTEGLHKLMAPVDAVTNGLKRLGLTAAVTVVDAVVGVGEAMTETHGKSHKLNEQIDAASPAYQAFAARVRQASGAITAQSSEFERLSADIAEATTSYSFLTEANRKQIAEMTTAGKLRGALAAEEGKVIEQIAGLFIKREADKKTEKARTTLFVLQADEKVRQSAEQLSQMMVAQDRLVSLGVIQAKQAVLQKQVELDTFRMTQDQRIAQVMIDNERKIAEAREVQTVARKTSHQRMALAIIEAENQIFQKQMELETNAQTQAIKVREVRVTMALEAQAAELEVEKLKEQFRNKDLLQQRAKAEALKADLSAEIAALSEVYTYKSDIATKTGEIVSYQTLATERIQAAASATAQWSEAAASTAGAFQSMMQALDQINAAQAQGFAANAREFGIEALNIPQGADFWTVRHIMGEYTKGVEMERTRQTGLDAIRRRQSIYDEEMALANSLKTPSKSSFKQGSAPQQVSVSPVVQLNLDGRALTRGLAPYLTEATDNGTIRLNARSTGGR